jgi:hypothetical protein
MGLRAVIPKFIRPARGPETDRLSAIALPVVPVAAITAWHRVGMKYDVRRMSKDDLRNLAHDLSSAGAISLPDLRLLSLEPVTYASHWPSWNAFETPAERDGRRDWIDEIETRLRNGHPEHAYLSYLQLLRSFLRRIETARREMSDAQRPARPEPARKPLAVVSSPANRAAPS